ncbi:D-aminoacylase [Halieaceae bacterium IMCC14734]|uniref:D-aminoacylase n=1 Tax=Candidatus Litorirhabdus singularis TaxID=2518993 RepID=A0ABT3TJG1_9GAMM|nr:amidohydrolase family protein [Candidatus Litorirhabdus singularis]MCX2982350.1 D-aminoacylase [Candidatus Litorirhabdus singularis]
MFDLIIRNGTLVDGTGRKAFEGDLAIKDGRIAAVGDVNGSATEELDASHLLVTPGWVDTHSHMDGQATWDPLLSPAVNHGITTLIMGNCGVGFAPCEPNSAARDRMIAVMEDVEDIPGAALHEGITWEWESFPEYLDTLDKFPRAIDVAAQVPHCAVRTYVMGDRGVQNEQATPADVEQMSAIVREGIEAGAIGFSTSRTELHRTREGLAMPGTYSDESELLGIGKVLGEIGKGIYQLVSDWDDWEVEMDWMKRLSIANKCQINFVLFYQDESQWPRVEAQLDYVRQANAEGARLVPHVGARPVNVLMNFNGTVHPFFMHQNFAPLAALSPEERLERLCDPAVRAAILAEPTPTMGIEAADRMAADFDLMYELGEEPDYEPTPDQSMAARAAAMGITPQELAYDTLLKRDGKSMLYFPLMGYDKGDLRRQVTMLEDENSVISLADTGAHCGVLSDASMPTYLLAYFVRDRTRGKRFELEQAVKMHTRDTARCVGLEDRGTLEVGMKADINLIDFGALKMDAPEIIYDLPAGGRRMFQSAQGYRATLVNGEVVMADGAATGALPGKLIRGAQAAPAA